MAKKSPVLSLSSFGLIFPGDKIEASLPERFIAESGKVCTEKSTQSGCRKQERVEGRY